MTFSKLPSSSATTLPRFLQLWFLPLGSAFALTLVQCAGTYGSRLYTYFISHTKTNIDPHVESCVNSRVGTFVDSCVIIRCPRQGCHLVIIGWPSLVLLGVVLNDECLFLGGLGGVVGFVPLSGSQRHEYVQAWCVSWFSRVVFCRFWAPGVTSD